MLVMLAAAAVLAACSQSAPGSYPGTFQQEDQKGFARFNRPPEVASHIQGHWSADKGQCHKGIALDRVSGYGTYVVNAVPKGAGTFEERLDEANSIYLHHEWIGRYYLAGTTLVLLSAGSNRIQRISHKGTTAGSNVLAFEQKEVSAYDLWEGTLLSAGTSGAGSLVRCDPGDMTSAYLASDPDFAKRMEAARQEKLVRESEAGRREQEAGKVFQEQKRFDAWVGQKRAEYKADAADSVLRQPPLLADQRHWIIGSSLAVGTVKFGPLQTVYVRMRYQANDQDCLKHSVCPEYLLAMRDGEAGKMLAYNSEVRGLVAKFVGVVNSAAGTPAPIFEPVELYQEK
jgi:hypothetical protein